MAYSYNEVIATGAPQLIAVPEYIDQSHIKVAVDGVDTTSFTWANTNTVSVTATLGATVRVRRESSPTARVVDYMDGQSLTEVVLDADSKQAFYLSQEQLDATAEALDAYGSLSEALATMQAAEADTQTHRVAAETAATNAAASATSATSSATAAGNSATAAAGHVATAEGHKNTATTKAGEAAASATAAANSVTLAQGEANLASTHASNASGHATSASNSATSAATSASSAASSASTASGSANPPGTVLFVAQSTAPVGYLKANGAVVSRASYANLYAAIGTVFNTGGEAGTDFRLPDMRGEFPRGWDDSRGVDSARVFGSAQAAAMQTHTHSVPSSAAVLLAGGAVGYSVVSSSQASGAPSVGAGTETRPRNVALLVCIKY